MSRPFLSVVTISFNQAHYLRQCVDSVVSQKMNDVEYIVVDPGSTDGSREILESYGDAIDYLVFDPDNGPADGLNKGFARATGDIGYFINSDDFLLPGAIDRMRELWTKHHDFDVLLCGAWMIDGKTQPLQEMCPTTVNLQSLLRSRAVLVQQGLSFRTHLLKRYGGFNPKNRTCWDFELVCDFLALGAKVKVCTSRLGVFRIHDESISGGVGGEALAQRYKGDVLRIQKKYGGGHASAVLDPTIKHLRNMRRFSCILRDRVFPNSMARRFFHDLGKLE